MSISRRERRRVEGTVANEVSRRQLLAGVAAAPLLPGAATPAAALPSRADVLAVARRVNDFWIAGHADPGDNQWARAVYFSGTMALHRATAEPRYLQYARDWAAGHGYALHNGVSTRHADDHMAGQVYYDLYEVDGDASALAAIDESIRRMVYSTSAPTTVDDWWWVDALHMAMPVFVRVARRTGDDAYLQKLWALYTHTKKTRALYDYTHELWWRDGDAKKAVSPAGRPVFWSRGNGWALAAHAKILALQPGLGTRWPEYRWNMQGLARALAATQRPDGFWNVNLADPAHFGGPETSGTAFFAYGLAFALRTGVIDRATYLPVVAKAWNGLVATAVRADGFLGWVQGVGYAPESSQPVTASSTADFGVGGFLLAATEVAKLAV
jgi:unsaturated rhamnogalacturonyl hydrolase